MRGLKLASLNIEGGPHCSKNRKKCNLGSINVDSRLQALVHTHIDYCNIFTFLKRYIFTFIKVEYSDVHNELKLGKIPFCQDNALFATKAKSKTNVHVLNFFKSSSDHLRC